MRRGGKSCVSKVVYFDCSHHSIDRLFPEVMERRVEGDWNSALWKEGESESRSCRYDWFPSNGTLSYSSFLPFDAKRSCM